MKRLFIVSLSMNVLFFGAAGYFVIKRLLFINRLEAQGRKHLYGNNPQYDEQLRIWSAYKGDKSIVLFGNSHYYKAHWDQLLGRGDISNQGIGSDITKGYLGRIAWALEVHPKICFIEGGANDVEAHISPDTVLANLLLVIDILRSRKIIPVVNTIPLEAPWVTGSEEFNAMAERINDRIRDFAAANHIDVIELSQLTALRGYLSPACAQHDGAHLNAEGYLRWRAEMIKVLEKYKI